MTTTNFREYPVTRFSSVYTQDGRVWHVYNDVAGHPVWADADAAVPIEKAFTSYADAKAEALGMGQHYRSVERGW